MHRDSHTDSFGMIVATAVAVTGLVSLALIDQALWENLNVQNKTMIQYGSAAAIAAAAAAVAATEPPARSAILGSPARNPFSAHD
jgi:hypothetical protein